MSVHCPICNAHARKVRRLEAGFLRDRYSAYYGATVGDGLGFIDYDQMRCPRCTLEFFWPMTPGNAAFYAWIAKQRSYYPQQRWEWAVVAGRVKSRTDSDVRLLEIGCGTGEFLKRVGDLPNVNAVGLDTTQGSVDIARSAGLDVQCLSLEDYLATDVGDGLFDVVAAFHCLEHVPDPKGFVVGMMAALKPPGSIFLSTPYSPMSFENQWFDPLNHPPHHLTRWNRRAYNELARQLGVTTRFTMPEAERFRRRMSYALNLAWFGPHHMASGRRLAVTALLHPLQMISELFHQAGRDRIGGKVAADVVLVELACANPADRQT
jgi:SAM-dependent methyltransferase